MRTALIIVGGLVLFAICLAGGRWLEGSTPESVALAARIFIPLWLCAALFNMYVGVSRAGYSVKEELPIFLVIFLVPASVAVVAWLRSGR